MNLFRSEEHVKSWSDFKAGTEEGINPLSSVVGLFSLNFFTKRLDADYVSRMGEYMAELIEVLKSMGSFWHPPKQ
ncbi:MAG: hypothetical protein WB792_09025 [Desulfobacterales bacterium]